MDTVDVCVCSDSSTEYCQSPSLLLLVQPAPQPPAPQGITVFSPVQPPHATPQYVTQTTEAVAGI